MNVMGITNTNMAIGRQKAGHMRFETLQAT